MLLRLFGADIAATAIIYPTARIWAPWNLRMAERSVLGDRVECYCVDRVSLHERAVVSQLAYLCAATRDIRSLEKPLVTRPIVVERDAWVCARAFVGPGVTVGEGAVVGACAVVMKHVPDWTIVAGNPAARVRARVVGSGDCHSTGTQAARSPGAL
jgi:putative colanic acid biosynthesis acetyltransferase WcaF